MLKFTVLYYLYILCLSFIISIGKTFLDEIPILSKSLLILFRSIASFFYTNQVKLFIKEQQNNVFELIALHTSPVTALRFTSFHLVSKSVGVNWDLCK